MSTAKSIKEIKVMSDDEIIREFDRLAETTQVGTSFYLDELRSRQNSRLSENVERFTRWILRLTIIVTAATIFNLTLFAMQTWGTLW